MRRHTRLAEIELLEEGVVDEEGGSSIFVRLGEVGEDWRARSVVGVVRWELDHVEFEEHGRDELEKLELIEEGQ